MTVRPVMHMNGWIRSAYLGDGPLLLSYGGRGFMEILDVGGTSAEDLSRGSQAGEVLHCATRPADLLP